MEQQNEVVLLGKWSSPYSTRVELALKLKGKPYWYIEEDLANKSPLLLQHNHVNKKIPVLLHHGKPVSESLVILEYIDECLDNTPRLLPRDPYGKAKVRFWANFFDQKVMPSTLPILISRGERPDRAKAIFSESLRLFEEGLTRDFPEGSPFFEGEALTFLGIVVGSSCCNYEAFQEATGLRYDLHKYPAFFTGLTALKECPLIRETVPTQDKMVTRIKDVYCTTVSKFK